MHVCSGMSLYLSFAQDCCTPVTLSLGKETVFPDADANVVPDAISFMFNFGEAVFRRVWPRVDKSANLKGECDPHSPPLLPHPTKPRAFLNMMTFSLHWKKRSMHTKPYSHFNGNHLDTLSTSCK
jgi:hypothetical protein